MFSCTHRSNISGSTAVTGIMLSIGGSIVGKTIARHVSCEQGYIARSNTIFCKIKDHKVHCLKPLIEYVIAGVTVVILVLLITRFLVLFLHNVKTPHRMYWQE